MSTRTARYMLDPLWQWADGGSFDPKKKLPQRARLETPVRSLKVIGAGPGRTGTASLKAALEELGFSPCYHMFECSKLKHEANWARALTTSTVADLDKDFEEILDCYGFKATVDFPASVAFVELMARYPDAKVILTQRDPKSWARSVAETIWSRYARERSWNLALWNRPFQRMACALMRSRTLRSAL